MVPVGAVCARLLPAVERERLLRRGRRGAAAHRPLPDARRSRDSYDDSALAGFTFDHDTNGAIAAEDEDRGLVLLRVDHGKVRTELLLRGDPAPWEAGFEAIRELPWLSPELSPDERNRRHNEATLAKLGSSQDVERG